MNALITALSLVAIALVLLIVRRPTLTGQVSEETRKPDRRVGSWCCQLALMAMRFTVSSRYAPATRTVRMPLS